MDAIKIAIASTLIAANATFAQPQPPAATSNFPSEESRSLPRLEDLPVSTYSPRMKQFKGLEAPEDEVLAVFFGAGHVFEIFLSADDLENFELHKSNFDSHSRIATAMFDVCAYALSLDEAEVATSEAEELARRLKQIDSDYFKKAVSTYSDLLQSSSEFAIRVYESYKQHIHTRIITKKFDYDYEATRNTAQFVANQKNVCSHI